MRGKPGFWAKNNGRHVVWKPWPLAGSVAHTKLVVDKNTTRKTTAYIKQPSASLNALRVDILIDSNNYFYPGTFQLAGFASQITLLSHFLNSPRGGNWKTYCFSYLLLVFCGCICPPSGCSKYSNGTCPLNEQNFGQFETRRWLERFLHT